MKNKKLTTGMYLGLNIKNTAQIMKKPFRAKENDALVFAQVGGGMSFANKKETLHKCCTSANIEISEY